MIRYLAVICFLPVLLLAQFSNFAPTADGSAVYFATQYSQKKSGQPTWGKIFVVEGQELRSYAVRTHDDGSNAANYYDLDAPSVSSDGRVVAYSGTRDCTPARQCMDVQFVRTTITGVPGRGEFTLDGYAYVSRNGRFGRVYQQYSPDKSSLGLWDLQTGVQLVRTSYLFGGPQSTADDGTTIFGDDLYRNGKLEPLPLGATDSIIDRAATSIAFISRWPTPYAAFSRLRLYDPAARSVRTLAEGAGDVYQPAFSDDGRQILFVSTARFSGPSRYGPPEAFVVGLDGSVPLQVSDDPAGIKTAVLAGNGRAAFLFTYGGRLLRIDLDAAAANRTTELIPHTPSCCFGNISVPAGSLATINGFGFYDVAGNPPILTFEGKPVSLAASTPGRLAFVVPWELAGRTVEMNLSLMSDSSFELPASATAQPQFRPGPDVPKIFDIPPEYGTQGGYGKAFGKAAHQNFEGLVTQDAPAGRGEIVHLYATGLGPVDSEGRTLLPFTCLTSQRIDAPVLFAGLAPGFAGVYQVDLQIPVQPPVDLSLPIVELICGSATTTLPIKPE